jgi:hypothetical protein
MTFVRESGWRVVEVSGEERKERRSSETKGEAEAQLASGSVLAF